MRGSLVLCALLATGCKSEPGADPSETETPSTPAKGSAGGFSASLSAELGSGSSGSSAVGPGAGSSMGSGAGSSSGTMAGSGAGSSSGTMAGSGAGSSSGTMAGSGAGSGAKVPVAAGSGSGSGSKPSATAAGSGAGSGSKVPVAAGSGAVASGSGAPPAVKPTMTPELRAIKLSLEPNWDRDQLEAASISFFEKNQIATFKFNYGYEDEAAPANRDAYKKFLADSGKLKVLADRQSGSAWYLEGTDATGHAAFRVVVTYGGKRLVCYGSLYKDSGLGDLRDSILQQAKKI